MRSRGVLPACVTIAALAAAAPASAFDWTGRLGGAYGRDDGWAADGKRTTMPYLDVSVGLSLNGFVYRPGALSYSGGVGYRRYSFTRPNEPEAVNDSVTYALQTTLFGHARSPLSAQLRATRSDGRNDPGGAAQASETTSQTYGGRLRYHQEGRPSLSVAYDRVESTARVPLVPDATRTVHFLEANTAGGGSAFSYNASYSTSFSEGTYAADKYDDHRVDVSAYAGVAENTTLQLSDTYFLRSPKIDSPFSPRHELNSLLAVLSNQASATDSHRGAYGYAHALQVLPAASDGTIPGRTIERTTQNLTYTMQHGLALHPEWRLGGSIAASLSQNRVDEEERRDTGQNLSGHATWTRKLSDTGRLQLSATETIGVIEPSGEDPDFGYGTSASARFGKAAGRASYDTSYEIGYASNIGERGTILRQSARGGAKAPAGFGEVHGDLTLSAARYDVPHLGVGGTRSATLGAGYAARAYSAAVSASVSSGISGTSMETAGGDGLFLPLPYDTHTYLFTASLGVSLTRRLRSALSAAYSSITAPDRPTVNQSEARAALAYVVGALTFSLEDRYTLFETPGGTTKRNVFMVNASRTFGTRY